MMNLHLILCKLITTGIIFQLSTLQLLQYDMNFSPVQFSSVQTDMRLDVSNPKVWAYWRLCLLFSVAMAPPSDHEEVQLPHSLIVEIQIEYDSPRHILVSHDAKCAYKSVFIVLILGPVLKSTNHYRFLNHINTRVASRICDTLNQRSALPFETTLVDSHVFAKCVLSFSAC
jgi:hypothetical protein